MDKLEGKFKQLSVAVDGAAYKASLVNDADGVMTFEMGADEYEIVQSFISDLQDRLAEQSTTGGDED